MSSWKSSRALTNTHQTASSFIQKLAQSTTMNFLLVLFVIGYGESARLNCYSCSSKTNETCLRPHKARLPLKACDSLALDETKNYAADLNVHYAKLFQVDHHSNDPLVPMNCLKQEVQVGQTKYVIRGCQLAATEKLDICVKVREIDNLALKTQHCSLCNSDGCNAGHGMGCGVLVVLAGTILIPWL